MQNLAALLTFVMLFIALYISAATTIQRMVQLYQAQALALAFMVVVTALAPALQESAVTAPKESLILVAIVPFLFALIVPPLLARATVAPLLDSDPESHSAQPRTHPGAAIIWLQHGETRLSQTLTVVFDLALTGLGFLMAYRLVTPGDLAVTAYMDANTLGVAITLLFVGVFTMSNKRDIVAQILGLLVMEHGLFLAAVKATENPRLTVLFVISLFAYVLITLLLLWWLLPALHRVSQSIEIDAQKELRG